MQVHRAFDPAQMFQPGFPQRLHEQRLLDFRIGFVPLLLFGKGEPEHEPETRPIRKPRRERRELFFGLFPSFLFEVNQPENIAGGNPHAGKLLPKGGRSHEGRFGGLPPGPMFIHEPGREGGAIGIRVAGLVKDRADLGRSDIKTPHAQLL